MSDLRRLAAAPRPFAPRRWGRLVLLGVVGIAALATVNGSYFVVQPTEMAGVRRFGVVTSTAPLGPGLHTKTPFVEAVDTLQVSLTTFQAPDLNVYTIDNQSVRIGIGLSYRVPPGAVFRLLYGVGRSGNVDTDGNLRPIVADRALRVFARRNTVSISAERESIANEIRRSVQEAMEQNFGIEIVDLQLSRIEYSAAFTQSVEAAVRAKNDALQAENTVARIRYEGEQAKVQAEAQAVAVATRSEGEAQATALLGQAQATAVQQVGAAVAANPRVVDYETARRWDGKLPATMLGGGTVPLLGLPGATPGR